MSSITSKLNTSVTNSGFTTGVVLRSNSTQPAPTAIPVSTGSRVTFQAVGGGGGGGLNPVPAGTPSTGGYGGDGAAIQATLQFNEPGSIYWTVGSFGYASAQGGQPIPTGGNGGNTMFYFVPGSSPVAVKIADAGGGTGGSGASPGSNGTVSAISPSPSYQILFQDNSGPTGPAGFAAIVVDPDEIPGTGPFPRALAGVGGTGAVVPQDPPYASNPPGTPGTTGTINVYY